MWKFKKLQSQNEPSPAQPENSHGGDYAVKKSKRTDMIARILAILAAVMLWVYVSTTDSTTEERNFSLVPVTYREESILKNEYGLIVQSINIDTLNVTLMGNKNDVRSIGASDVKAYVNLGSITEAGEYTLDVYVDVPSGTTCVAQTVDKVVVSVDKPSTKILPLSADKIELEGWVLDGDCFFGNMTLNADQIVLEGPTLELEEIADVIVRTDMIGNASSSFHAMASVHFLDSDGNEIVNSGVSVRNGNESASRLQVSVQVLKKAKVELKLEGKNGILSNEQAALSPSYVWVTGEPDRLPAQNQWVVGRIDESELTSDTVKSYPLSLEGVEVTDENGEPITSVTASVRATAQSTESFVISNVPLLQNDAAVGYLTVEVTGKGDADIELLRSLKASHITVYLPVGAAQDDYSKMIVAFDKAYIASIADYRLYGFRGVA